MMAEIILTEEEKSAVTWAELDDDSLGKVVKAGIFSIKKIAKEQDKMFFMAAAIILCSIAADSNADKLTQTLEGLKNNGQPLGDWKITIKKLTKDVE